jgi:kelch-like protein 10
MLSCCEKYNIKKNSWTFIDSMVISKCAFAAVAVNNEFIYTFGGFNGHERLNTIERYDPKDG